MSEVSHTAERAGLRAAGFLGAILFAVVYILLALLFMRQWSGESPWSRVDLFSGGALVLSAMMGLQQLGFSNKVARSREVMSEAFGTSYDPAMMGWVVILAIAELSVFLDYGHWRLVPALRHSVLQTIGLVLYILAVIWFQWVDKYLVKNFAREAKERNVITAGPFQYVRHPRYLGLIASRVAFALSFGSLLGWLTVVGWVLLVMRRIRLEEHHMRELFGVRYEMYASQTARLLPGVY